MSQDDKILEETLVIEKDAVYKIIVYKNGKKVKKLASKEDLIKAAQQLQNPDNEYKNNN